MRFAHFYSFVFYLLHTNLIKNALENRKYGCYNVDKRKTFSIQVKPNEVIIRAPIKMKEKEDGFMNETELDDDVVIYPFLNNR